MAEETIVNKVARSGLQTIDLETLFPEGERVGLDIADWLWQGLVLREKEFRTRVKETDWSTYDGKHVAVWCSADAIVPQWAYMLLATVLEPHAATVRFGDLEALEEQLIQEAVLALAVEDYRDARVVIKGCSDRPVPPTAYVTLTARLRPVVRSLMYGEPCSTVPLYKRPKPTA